MKSDGICTWDFKLLRLGNTELMRTSLPVLTHLHPHHHSRLPTNHPRGKGDAKRNTKTYQTRDGDTRLTDGSPTQTLARSFPVERHEDPGLAITEGSNHLSPKQRARLLTPLLPFAPSFQPWLQVVMHGALKKIPGTGCPPPEFRIELV